MPYEINVSKNGKHFFATHARSMANHSEREAIQMAQDFQQRFPAADGYQVDLARVANYMTKIVLPE